ncbi:hypothetical protein NEOLI_005396 [Neolecta irregularis DAH-3]|uniref:Uncharacterized protein n=1 Tax=Neolecta irregularis (strain DAH-3) TaxID=1198029 RepID=A0A1U7LIG3_NEOID|nr:hypothetical protein NEOLI_005396 [Neolecta irregularis DAH-3]|eukprot:OLL22321.1 hypothetical protein NEOLI_005396 [Neolecta irregularis DAH-3]
MQIIINRVCLLFPLRKHRLWLKYGIAALVLCINIVGFPFSNASVQNTSGHFIAVKSTVNRIEKISYLFIDAGLNFYFIHLVHTKLKGFGFRNYETLIRFNVRIVIVSLILNVILGGSMWSHIDYLYFQFLPGFNLVKLNIEMSMGDLIVALSKEPIHTRVTLESRSTKESTKTDGEIVQTENP